MKVVPKKQEGLLLKVLLNRAYGKTPEKFLHLLPPHLQEAVRNQTTEATNPTPLIHFTPQLFDSIHYSWIYHYLKDLPFEESRLMVAVLNEKQRRPLAKLFNQTTLPAIHSPLLKQFFLPKLIARLKIHKHMPVEYLNNTPISALLNLSKKDLIALIDLLGIYDLASEVRQIVGTKNLKNLYSCLTPEQHQFLRICLHQKDKVIVPKLKLDHWNGDCALLQKILHRRGLSRFAASLSGEDPDLIWHLIHTFDIGRGSLIKKMVREGEIPIITQAVRQQLESALHYIQEGKK